MTLYCIHHHTIVDHPACFASGALLPSSVEEYTKGTGRPWYTYPGYKIGYLDIEVDNLKADFGTMLSWAIKEKGGKTAYDVVTKDELFNGTTDQRIVASLVAELRKYQIIVTYYGTGFDIPYSRAKALHYNLEFPGYGDLYHFDIYYTVKSKLAISRKSLAVATAYLGIPGKTPLTGEVWNKAKYGDIEALNEVVIHNIADVEILETLHDRLNNFSKWTKKSI